MCAVYIYIIPCTHVANIQLCNIKVPEVRVGAPLPLLNYKTLHRNFIFQQKITSVQLHCPRNFQWNPPPTIGNSWDSSLLILNNVAMLLLNSIQNISDGYLHSQLFVCIVELLKVHKAVDNQLQWQLQNLQVANIANNYCNGCIT